MPDETSRERGGARVEEGVRRMLARREPLVLAVSGGRDSMAMLTAVARLRPPDVPVLVATFDHGTGEAAARAARLVAEAAGDAGLDVVTGRADRPLAGEGEAAWRDARWAFLRALAGSRSARVATAHTRDDQIETVFLRALRDAGPRGLAGLYARTPVLRPLLDASRAEVAAYAAATGARFLDDPSNASLRHLRNRARLEILPALERAHPGFGEALLALARRAATWRRDVERLASGIGTVREGRLDVPAGALAGLDRDALAVLWPAIAARAGVTLDHRGTRRLAAFTTEGGIGRVIQLSGGVEVGRARHAFTMRRSRATRRAATRAATDAAQLLKAPYVPSDVLSLGQWRFRPVHGLDASRDADPWMASLPDDAPIRVRAWRPGDRMRARGAHAARRVKRYLLDAGVTGLDRAGWPVVLAGDEIIWIPGVRRGEAATERPGRPGVAYVCERCDDD